MINKFYQCTECGSIAPIASHQDELETQVSQLRKWLNFWHSTARKLREKCTTLETEKATEHEKALHLESVMNAANNILLDVMDAITKESMIQANQGIFYSLPDNIVQDIDDYLEQQLQSEKQEMI